jgi:trans-2,3-dihydro-3-hydroxyanthranilate isomerase
MNNLRSPFPPSLRCELRYLQVDVFTDKPFEGNQLAVFPEPGNLDASMMQAITREMNFSECTFVLPPERGGDVRMRIFTPGEELPMAGHPTIGTTFALAAEGTIAPRRSEFVFELGVGPTPVALEWDGDALSFAWMTQRLPEFGGTIRDRAALASAIGLAAEDVPPQLPPAQVVSCGVPFLFVPLASRRAVDALSIDRKSFARCCRDAGVEELPAFFFTTEGDAEEGAAQTVYSRMLAPGFGIGEDPATGGASGPLGCYLLHHEVVPAEAARNILSLQGVLMKRPSRIHISIDSHNGAITRVRVGGRSVLVGRGELRF